MTPDPIGLAGGINLYPYALNNPVNAVDPWGLTSAGHLDWFSRSLSFNSGVPPSINPVPIPWGEYKKFGKIVAKNAADVIINAITTVEIMIINPELFIKEMDPLMPSAADAAVRPADAAVRDEHKCE